MESRIVIESRDGVFGAYIARPAVLPAPAVVVLHEVFGVSTDIRKTCTELAALGFIGVAPDLFWRQESRRRPRCQSLSPTGNMACVSTQALRSECRREGRQRYTAVAAAELPDCTGKVAVLGCAFGGS